MNISTELFQIAGFFYRYRETGGTLTAEEAQQMSAKLGMLAEGVLNQERAEKSLADEFDRYIEDQCSERPGIIARPRSARAFTFTDGRAALVAIDGGRASAEV